jgi:hypothetical protein
MDNLINIFFAPAKVFTSLKEKPDWTKPFFVFLAFMAIVSALTIVATKDTIAAQQESALRERGMTEEQIQQAQQFIGSPVTIVIGAVGAMIATAAILLIFALLLNVFIPLLGGKGSYRHVFSLVSHCTLVNIPGQIIRIVLMFITRTPYVSTSLALLAPNLAKHSFLFRVLNGIDFFVFWEMCLVAYGITHTNAIKKENAYILVFAIWVISILAGSLIGGPRMMVN